MDGRKALSLARSCSVATSPTDRSVFAVAGTPTTVVGAYTLPQARSERKVRREHVAALGLAPGDRVEIKLALDRYYAVLVETFTDAGPGELILYEDSYGLMTLAISRGDAAGLTGVAAGGEIRIAVA
jgi:hypothetical protein